jgi:hypothetical protein
MRASHPPKKRPRPAPHRQRGSLDAAWQELARQLAREAPVWGRDPAVVQASILAEPDVATLGVARLLVAAEWAQSGSMEGMIESMLGRTSVPTPAAVLQARRNAAARHELLREFGALTSGDIAILAGSKAHNRAALSNRWKHEGRIFAVSHQGTAFYPAFQFESDGRPREVVARVLSAVAGKLSDWGVALWFTGANGWLGGRRPVDLLTSDPDRVAAAAAREAEDLVF